jgi:DUF917 family protein
VVLTDGYGNAVVLRPVDDSWAERLARSTAVGLGGVCAAALYCMTAGQAQGAVIEGSLTRAHALGDAMLSGRDDPGSRVLIAGKVIDVERRAAGGGFTHGAATIEGMGGAAGRQMRLEFQNEFVLAIEDGDVCAAAPDVISVLTTDDGVPVPTERLSYGQRVAVLGSVAPDVWRSAAGLAVSGPRAFGYDVDHVPLATEESGGRG